ncbi:MAG: SDR family oxidoreductase, partial [Bacteroidetes bacterium]|nr:SDR family oxidoreductase [Bacteroidota bacterium]
MANYLIIGGSSGIGNQLAKQLAEANHLVYATYNTHIPELEIKNVYFQSLDVMNETLNLEFIPDILDGLIYCPGSIQLRPFARISPDDFLSDYQLQVVGAIKSIQKVMPNLKNSSHASIVLFSTLAVQTGLSFHSQVSASKGAIEGLTRSLAAEFAPKIRVNAVAPSLTNTPLA